ncbi:MAG: DHH family phosphoesterase [Candidatus Diapherotrites archaeon]|nr:DHH family phosphoesterase [Candidatus Diapherotrites archaeon]
MDALQSVVDFIKDNDDFCVVCHFDADGLCAGSIASLVLERLGKKHSFFPTKQLDSERVQKIRGMGKHYWFVDFGSGQVPVLEENFDSFAICDHHETLGETDRPHLNAHLIGLDGAKEISGAGVTYLAAKAVDPANADLSALAVVGAVGDMQDASGALEGKNRELLQDAVEAGVMEYGQDIRLFGRHSRPLVQFLSYATDPIFPGLTANEAGCLAFLKGIGIEPDNRYYVDLSEDDRKRLISALVVYGRRNNIPPFILKQLVGEVYELTREENKTFVKDAKDFATLLNACGRHDAGEVGVRVAMGDRGEWYAKARTLLQNHRRLLREGIEFASQKGVEVHTNCYVLDAGHSIQDSIIGVIAGMLYGAQVIQQDKPIIAFSFDEAGRLKVSARATWSLVRRGLHLGRALKRACEGVGGEGGGHSIAAGARIPPEKRDEFIRVFDAIVGEQLS